MSVVVCECDCGLKVEYSTALKDGQTLLGNATLADTLLMAFDAHACPTASSSSERP